jgi:hypothetical protein
MDNRWAVVHTVMNTSGATTRREFLVAEELLACQERPCLMELTNWLVGWLVRWFVRSFVLC